MVVCNEICNQAERHEKVFTEFSEKMSKKDDDDDDDDDEDEDSDDDSGEDSDSEDSTEPGQIKDVPEKASPSEETLVTNPKETADQVETKGTNDNKTKGTKRKKDDDKKSKDDPVPRSNPAKRPVKKKNPASKAKPKENPIDVLDDKWDIKTTEDFDRMVKVILPSIKYKGFDPALIRRIFVENSDDHIMFVKRLMICFSGYAEVGNSVGKLSTKRKDPEFAQRMAQVLTTLGIKKKAVTSDDLTLPRLAIAFMPLYLLFRIHHRTRVPVKSKSNLPIEHQDICFSGYAPLSGSETYHKFHLEFSSLIYIKEKGVKLDNPEFLTSVARWRDVSEKGYAADKEIHDSMDEIFKMNTTDNNTTYNAFIREYKRVFAQLEK